MGVTGVMVADREALRLAIQANGLYVCAPGEAIPGQNGEEWHNVFRVRRITQDGGWLSLICTLLTEMMVEDGLDPGEVQFAGAETGSIPLVAALALRHATTGFTARKKARNHGARNLIEGPMTDKPVVLIDDLVSAGHRVWQCVDTIGIRASHLTIHPSVYTLLRNKGDGPLKRGQTELPVRAVFKRADFDFAYVPSRVFAYRDMLR
jgi:orotate phosphoribosyltransferase